MRDRVGLANRGQELVAESLAFRRAGDQARDVDELDRCRTTRSGRAIPASGSKRGSGTSTMPTLGSMVQKG